MFLDEIQAIFGSRESGSRLGSSMIAQLACRDDNLEQMNQLTLEVSRVIQSRKHKKTRLLF